MASRGVSHRYLPALDGLRAFAVLAVFAFHLGFPHAGGGYLGVDIFFVLSGFLITGLLVEEKRRTGKIRLPAFWGRRARRLLPALLVLLAALSVYAWAGGSGVTAQSLRPDALATLFYFANWHFLFSQQPYFGQFITLSPLMHTWSLAIEEQFYLFWPLMLVAVMHTRRKGKHAPAPHGAAYVRKRALIFSIIVTLASAGWMAALYHNAAGQDRAYFGTDARAFELLLGASLALVLARTRRLSGSPLRILHAAAVLAIGGLIAMIVLLPDRAAWMYHGGFFLATFLAAVVIASISQQPSGPLGAVLSLRPIRWIGKISYGLYLWHWPVIDLMTDGNTRIGGTPLVLAQIATTFAVATLSFYLIEQPIRRARFSGWRRFVVAPIGVSATASLVLLGTVPLAQASVAPALGSAKSAQILARATGKPAPPGPVVVDPVAGTDVGQTPAGEVSTAVPITLPPSRVLTPADPLRVVVVGDSVMETAEPGLAAALEATGVVRVIDDTYPGFGLTHTPGWRTSFPSYIRRYHPELVIGSWSWDSEAAQADPLGYSNLLDEAVQTFLQPGNGVDGLMLLEFPKAGSIPADVHSDQRIAAAQAQEVRRQVWNAVAQGIVTLWPGKMMFLAVASSLEVNGHFTTWLPTVEGWVRARTTDNTHICPAGAAAYAGAVLSQLTPVFHLPSPAPSWWSGSWTKDRRYDYPPGACPADQPPPGYGAQLAPGAPLTSQFH